MKKEISIEVKENPVRDTFFIKISNFPIIEVDAFYAITILGSMEKVLNMTPEDYLTLSMNRKIYGRQVLWLQN